MLARLLGMIDALRVMDALDDSQQRAAHGNGGHIYRTSGRQSRSLRQRSNNRKAARRAKSARRG
jgi:hypothetical protein